VSKVLYDSYCHGYFKMSGSRQFRNVRFLSLLTPC
jgi:hypothetical protein